VNRRASLPGVDELFGSRETEAPARHEEPTAEVPPDRARRIDEAVHATVRRLTAAEDEELAAARDRAAEVVAVPIPEVGALLAWAVHATQARTVVEVGAAGGVTGLWLLRALPERGVLTSLEPDAHAHGLARDAFQRIGAGPRVRSIHGDAATVLPRLADASYDLFLLQGSRGDFPADLGHARRLLRPGGMLITRGILRMDEHGEQVARFVEDLAEDPSFEAVVLPVDDGVALATRREDDPEA
jgi:predicted O-methyltransferase YrrM